MGKGKKINIDHIHLDKDGLGVVVNDFEAEMLQYLWRKGACTVKDIYNDVGKKKGVALTTIGVTLDRMHSKGLTAREVERARGGLRYIYSANMSKKELGESIADSVVEKLVSAFGNSIVSKFRGN